MHSTTEDFSSCYEMNFLNQLVVTKNDIYRQKQFSATLLQVYKQLSKSILKENFASHITILWKRHRT